MAILQEFDISSSPIWFLFVPLILIFLFLLSYKLISKERKLERGTQTILANSFWDFLPHLKQHVQYTSNFVLRSPTSTFLFNLTPFHQHIITANPSNVKHILKDRFDIYEKDPYFKLNFTELLGDGIFNTDGKKWKFQRQVSSHEFNTKSLRKFVEHVVNFEISERLVPILSEVAENNSIIDLQDIFQRFTLDTICKIAFGYDPMCLLPSLPKVEFGVAFDEVSKISNERFFHIHRSIWKMKRFFNIGSEKKLKAAVLILHKFAIEIIKEKKAELKENHAIESHDILSRFLSSGIGDENFNVDVIINIVLAGRDTTSSALTWFFWLLSKSSRVEREILLETGGKVKIPVYDETKDMFYTHAALSESMRLYPPVPIDIKVATENDVLPSGLKVEKGDTVVYNSYAMGRSEELWGKDWAEFQPERWLENKKFVPRDPYVYPVFHAGPRICLGKDMAYLQMKRVVSEVLQRFKVVPMFEEGVEPLLESHLTIRMRDGFPVQIKKRNDEICENNPILPSADVAS